MTLNFMCDLKRNKIQYCCTMQQKLNSCIISARREASCTTRLHGAVLRLLPLRQRQQEDDHDVHQRPGQFHSTGNWTADSACDRTSDVATARSSRRHHRGSRLAGRRRSAHSACTSRPAGRSHAATPARHQPAGRHHHHPWLRTLSHRLLA